MVNCGFCKKEIGLSEDEPNCVKKEKFKSKISRFYGFVCPHCDSLLGIAGPF
jgi:hypothetical protein